jgi:hypothetical protein
VVGEIEGVGGAGHAAGNAEDEVVMAVVVAAMHFVQPVRGLDHPGFEDLVFGDDPERAHPHIEPFDQRLRVPEDLTTEVDRARGE